MFFPKRRSGATRLNLCYRPRRLARTTLPQSEKVSYYTFYTQSGATGGESISVFYQLPQNPSRLGDLVGLAFRMYRKNWRYLSGRLLVLSLLASVAVAMIQVSILNFGQSLKNSEVISPLDFGMLGGGLIIILICQYFLALRATAIYREMFGLSKDFEAGLAYAKRRRWAVFSVFTVGASAPIFVAFYCVMIALVIFGARLASPYVGTAAVETFIVVGGFIMVVLMVVATAITLLFSMVLFAAISSEDELKFLKVIVRAIDLTIRYPFRGGSYMCLLGLAVLAVVFSMSIFLMPFEAWEAYRSMKNSEMVLPLYLRFLETISQTVNNVVSMAVVCAGAGLYYRDVRFRSEGADLVEKLDSIQANNSLSGI
jgi:hypothetical protein